MFARVTGLCLCSAVWLSSLVLADAQNFSAAQLSCQTFTFYDGSSSDSTHGHPCSANCESVGPENVSGTSGGGQFDAGSEALNDACAPTAEPSGVCTFAGGSTAYYEIPDAGCCEQAGNECGDGDPCCSGSTCGSDGRCTLASPPAGVCTPLGNSGCVEGTMTGCCAGVCTSGVCLNVCATNNDCPGEVGCTGESCGCTDACDDPGCPGWTTSCAMGDSCTSDDDCPGGLVCVSGSCGCSDICDDPSCDPDGNYATDCGGGGGGYDPCADYYDDACCEDGYDGNNNDNNGNGPPPPPVNNNNCAGLGQYCGLGSVNMNGTTGCCENLVCGWDAECDW